MYPHYTLALPTRLRSPQGHRLNRNMFFQSNKCTAEC